MVGTGSSPVERYVDNEPHMTADSLPKTFGVFTRVAGVETIVAVRGDADITTAPEFRAVLDAAIEQGARSVVIELIDLGVMDSYGLVVIAQAARHLASLGGQLTIRSPSSSVQRLLEVARINDLSHVFDLEVAPDSLARQLAGEGVEAPVRLVTTPQSQQIWLSRGVTPVHEMVDAVLQLVVALARSIIRGADGVSVSLRRDGRLVTVAASDQTITDMDASQYATGEGPCIDASVQGLWFQVDELAVETRWPGFTPLAKALGINAIMSTPLHVGDRPLGAINIYSRTESAFDEEGRRMASVFAAEASKVLRDARLEDDDRSPAQQFEQALRCRTVITQAQGVIMERVGVADDIAYTILRRFASQSGQPLEERARAVVASTQRAGPGPTGTPNG
jgi:anti-anti-sigma factor